MRIIFLQKSEVNLKFQTLKKLIIFFKCSFYCNLNYYFNFNFIIIILILTIPNFNKIKTWIKIKDQK